MRVAHADTHITHAVIGGRQSMDFGISDDPAFFQILSSALYKDPMLAMVRETICNAWDAHLEFGCTDTAIKITLTDDYLTIQDFGPGIPDHLILPVYGVYGASTKKNDGRQTGGFGLGCKSPFAYNDHFEVTSCHQGTKTIYNMSKSSAQVAGKPAIVPIASFPTTETGITVKIPLKIGAQNHRLAELVRQVVFNGDIKATYNCLDVATLGMDKTEFGLVLIPTSTSGNSHHLVGSQKKERINIRYGNVIYPVEPAEQYSDLYRRVDGLLRTHYECHLVMMAPADSISMTPSRESLTQSEITVQTITNLLSKFLSIFLKNQRLLFKHNELVHTYIDEAASDDRGVLDKLDIKDWSIPGIPEEIGQSVLSTTDDFAKLDVLIRYSGKRGRNINAKKWFGYIQRYLHKANEAKIFDQGLMMTWTRAVQKKLKRISQPNEYNPTANDSRIATGWWVRQVLAPLVLNLKETIPNFDLGMLEYVSRYAVQQKDSYGAKIEPIRTKRVRIKNHLYNLVHFLKPTVILTHNSNQLPYRVSLLDSEEYTGTIRRGVFFTYEIGRKRETVAAVQAAFALVPGIEFIDMTGRLPCEQLAYEARQQAIAKDRAAVIAGRTPSMLTPKKVKPGAICLGNLIDGKRIDTMQFTTNRDPARVVEPKAVIIISTAKDQRRSFAYMSKEVSYALAKLYGDEIAISNKTDAVERLLEKGAMDINAYLKLKIMDAIENSPTMQAYHEATPDKISAYIHEKAGWDRQSEILKFVTLLGSHPEFTHLIPDVPGLDEEDQMRWLLWEHMSERTKDADVAALKDKIEAIPLKAEIVTFLDEIIANPFVESIDAKHMNRLMRASINDPAAIAKVTLLLTTILQ